jgi:hypothetical protein
MLAHIINSFGRHLMFVLCCGGVGWSGGGWVGGCEGMGLGLLGDAFCLSLRESPKISQHIHATEFYKHKLSTTKIE